MLTSSNERRSRESSVPANRPASEAWSWRSSRDRLRGLPRAAVLRRLDYCFVIGTRHAASCAASSRHFAYALN
jgi:hypothetical protein